LIVAYCGCVIDKENFELLGATIQSAIPFSTARSVSSWSGEFPLKWQSLMYIISTFSARTTMNKVNNIGGISGSLGMMEGEEESTQIL